MPHANGFDLVLGNHYNDGWFNAATPQHTTDRPCTQCLNHSVTIHRLEKIVLAFGHLIVKNCTIWTCRSCLHEVLMDNTQKPKQKATKQNLVRLFSRLPKSVQAQILLKGKS